MIRRMATLGPALCIALAFSLAGFAGEGVPQLLNYQGKLADSAGRPVDAPRYITFEFYDAPFGGNLLAGFSETQQVVVTKGIFNVLIGSATEGGVPASVFDGAEVYLCVKVQGDELSPRQRIASVAYAIRSVQADSSLRAAEADHATAADTAVDANSLQGHAASEFALKGDCPDITIIQAALADVQARLSAIEAAGFWTLIVEPPQGTGSTIPGTGSHPYLIAQSGGPITAIPDSGWVFDHWEGTAVSDHPNTNPIEISFGTIGVTKTLRAVFALAPMCLVPAGTFRTSTGVDVYLGAYFIDTYEVTNELYCQFLNAGGNDDHWRSESSIPPYEQQIIKHGPGSYSVATGMAQRPVRHVSWHDAVAFCDWRSAAEGLPAGTYRLPTEAQWEKAAGWDPVAGKLWTYAIQSDTISCGTVNYDLCVGRTTDVGSYPHTSFYGCYDMSGNLWEWCADWWQSSYPSGSSDPTGPESGSSRVLRGGGWDYGGADCRVSIRGSSDPASWRYGLGFRCARTSE